MSSFKGEKKKAKHIKRQESPLPRDKMDQYNDSYVKKILELDREF